MVFATVVLAATVVVLLGALTVAGQKTQSCKNELLSIRVRINQACCSKATDCPHGVPLRCDNACAQLWLPFSERCQLYIKQIDQSLSSLCQPCTAIDCECKWHRDGCPASTRGDGDSMDLFCIGWKPLTKYDPRKCR